MIAVQTPACIVCHATSVVTIPEDALLRLKAKEPIQKVLPEYTADERELLISGTHSECWDEIMPDPDEDGWDEQEQPF